MKYKVFVTLLLFTAMLVLPVSASSPEITTWYNDKTDNDSRDITINTSETIKFNVTANQSIDTWNWSIDDSDVQNNNYDNFTTSWDNAGIRNVSVNATNKSNDTSSTITWKVTVKGFSPEISSWSNNKTNDESSDITINTSETIKFNVTANQSIESWNWSIGGDVETNNYDNFTTFWATEGVKNVSVNATNSNGTSNTVTWNITVKEPVTITSPEITSWYNNKTNNDDLKIFLNINETIKFNVTANQSIVTWNWSVDNIDQDNNYDNFSTLWDSPGKKEVSVNATNLNGSDIITWEITVKNVTEDNIIISYTPKEIVDYISVNDTINETITYSITTSVEMDEYKWTVDGKTVTGNVVSDNNYSYTHVWNNESIGSPHKVIFTGSYDNSQVEFRWYVNVYDIGDYSGGHHLFGIIDDALRNHATDVQIRMIKRHRVNNPGNGYVAQKVNLLHDEIDKRQSTRAALRDDFKSGKISNEEYVAAQQQAQLDAKYNQKLLKELEKNMTISKGNNGKGNNGKGKGNE